MVLVEIVVDAFLRMQAYKSTLARQIRPRLHAKTSYDHADNEIAWRLELMLPVSRTTRKSVNGILTFPQNLGCVDIFSSCGIDRCHGFFCKTGVGLLAR